MSFLRWLGYGSMAAALVACGLDSNGLGADDGGAAIEEAGGPSTDGTVGSSSGSGGSSGGGSGSSSGGGSGSNSGGGSGGGSGSSSGGSSGGGDDDASDGTAPPSEGGGADSGQDSSIEDAGADTGSHLDASDGAPGDSGGSDAADAAGPTDAGEDAADGACPGTCTIATVPPGWSIVELEETASSSTPPCSTGYGSPVDIVEGPSGAPATCSCSCALTAAGSCVTGDYSLYVNGIVPNCPTGPFTETANDGGCATANPSYSPMNGAAMKVDPAPYAPGECEADASVATAPVAYTATGRVCASSSSPTGTCPNGGSCATTPTGFSLCIAHAGTQPSCPAGFPNSPHFVGTTSDVSDTRGCSACGCSVDAGCEGSLSFFTDTACTQGQQTVTANGTCSTFPGPLGGIGSPGPKYTNYLYAAQTQNEACTPSSPSATGGVSFSPTQTICCQ